jgi:hypothetical protein
MHMKIYLTFVQNEPLKNYLRVGVNQFFEKKYYNYKLINKIKYIILLKFIKKLKKNGGVVVWTTYKLL